MEKQDQFQIERSPENQNQKFEIYATLRMDSINTLEIHKDTIKMQFLNREVNWKNVLAINAFQQQKVLTKIEIILFSKQKRWFKGIVRRQESIQFYIMPQFVEKLLLQVRRFITHSQIDNPKFLIFHNPISGADSVGKLQKGLQFIKKTHFVYQVVTTKYKNHCKQYLIQKRPTRQQYWGIAIFSGDGLMHEFVNADVDVPVVHIPSGSGNGFAKNQAILAGQQCGVEQNLFIAMKGIVTQSPLLQIELEKIPQKIYSMLNVQWAFLADIDMESEHLRFLGTLRFEVLTIWRLLFLRTYRAKISISETNTNLPNINQPIVDPAFKTQEIDIYNFLLLMVPYIGQKYKCAPLINVKSQFMDLQINPQSAGRFNYARYMFNFQQGTQFDLDTRTPRFGLKHNLIKAFRLQPLGERRGVMGIDGEQFEPQIVQGKWIQDGINIFTLD